MNENEESKNNFINNPSNDNNVPIKISLISQTTRKTSHQAEHPSKRWGHTVILNYLGMIIFGGRHNLRNISNIYSLDFQTLSWSKIEQIGNVPQARDSHSAVAVIIYFLTLFNSIVMS